MPSRDINDLYEPIRPLVRKLLEEAQKLMPDWTAIVTDGFRTAADQQKLYNSGRFGNPGSILTYAKPGFSFHEYGLAVDIGWVKGKELSYAKIDALGKIGKNLGFGWGGDWVSKDRPHFEYTKGLTLAQIKAGQRPVVSPIIEPMGLRFPIFRDKSTGRVYYRGFDMILQYVPNPTELERFWPGVVPEEVTDITTLGTPLESLISEKNTLSAGVLQLREELVAAEKRNAEIFAALSTEITTLKTKLTACQNQPPIVKEVPVPEESLGIGRLFELLVSKILGRG